MESQFDIFIILYFILINVIAFFVYGIDKKKAIKHEWRISERTLLYFSLLGGPYGSFIGMKFFHHKINKKKFYLTVPLMMFVYLYIIFDIFFL